jgi:uncharacterized protein (TIGR02246 family)
VRRLALAAVLLLAALPVLAQAPASDPTAEIRSVIRTQTDAWNRGDLETFTSYYADDATFLSPTGVTQGRQQVLDRYRKRYPDKKAMGTLSLEPIEMRPVSGVDGKIQAVSVAARWRLEFSAEPEHKPAEGLTLIVLHRTAAGWRIVQDASM